MNTIGKSKFYLLVAIMAVIVLTVGLSFCAWDTTSVSKLLSGSKTANYGNNYLLNIDNNDNGKADLGDTVLFGNYFQQANGVDKTAIEWRVVDIRTENSKDVLYLLSDKAFAVGSFWGSENYWGTDGVLISSGKINQRYNDSTVRSWLNSLARTDGGTNFNGDNTSRRVFNGFYNEAFTATQKATIIGRTIEGMSGSFYGDTTPTEAKPYAALPNEKVWLPSFMEIYGVDHSTRDGEKWFMNDNPNDRQFQYFKGVHNVNSKPGNTVLMASSTEYVLSSMANYTNINATHAKNLPDSYADGSNWRLRTPWADLKNVSHVNSYGDPSAATPFQMRGAIRPAICLAR